MGLGGVTEARAGLFMERSTKRVSVVYNISPELDVHVFVPKLILKNSNIFAMKRSLSDTEADDLFDDDDSSKYGSPSQSCHSSDRKRRRGVIEKRRRDKINNSLSELRRLVPTAFEKQGSAKLEKAEILQMTVDHLNMLQQKGLNNYNFDPHGLSTDYRGFGFRECASEVARYLVTVEGMDLQDPLRLRLLNHLQNFSQRVAPPMKGSLQSSAWNTMSSHASFNASTLEYGSSNGNNMTSLSGLYSSQHGQNDHLSNSSHSGPAVSYSDNRLCQSDNMSSLYSHMRLPSSGSDTTSLLSSSSNDQVLQPLPQLPPQLPMSLNMNSLPMSAGGANSYNPVSSSQHHLGLSLKPYRPWGSELAY